MTEPFQSRRGFKVFDTVVPVGEGVFDMVREGIVLHEQTVILELDNTQLTAAFICSIEPD